MRNGSLLQIPMGPRERLRNTLKTDIDWKKKLEEMNKSLVTYGLPKLSQDAINNLT